MADEAMQEALRKARHAGVLLCPMPPPAVLTWLKREAAFESTSHSSPSPVGLLAWLRSFGMERMCLAPGPARVRCDLDVGHDGDHERTSAKIKRIWPRNGRLCAADCDEAGLSAPAPGMRWRCLLPAEHGGYHAWEQVAEAPHESTWVESHADVGEPTVHNKGCTLPLSHTGPCEVDG